MSGYIINKSKTDSWGTPPSVYDPLHAEFNFDKFDPCPLSSKPEFDGLKCDWADATFVNPPYSQLKSTKKHGIGWIEKGHLEAQKGKTVVFLIPSRTDTTWFHDIILKNDYEVRFMRGRIKFIDKTTGIAKGTAPFATMIIVMRKNP